MERTQQHSYFRKYTHDGMLLKLNSSALNIPTGDDKPLRFWLDQAKRTLKKVLERSMLC
jgi:hypothetical protein